MTIIRGVQLTTFDVAPDGESVAIHVTDDQGSPSTLVLPTECLNALMMTLPDIVRRSLQARYGDPSMRVVYPVGSWSLERSAVPGNVIVTLRTPDGFSVSFGLSPLELLRMWTQGASTAAEPGGVIGN
jgi:hypothetical protein